MRAPIGARGGRGLHANAKFALQDGAGTSRRADPWPVSSRPASCEDTNTSVDNDGFFRTIGDTSPVLLWSTGTDVGRTFFNQQWLTFAGRPMAMELGMGWADGVHPEDLAGCVDVYSKAFAARTSFRLEYRLRRADGVYRWLLDNGVPFHALDGSFAGFIGSCIDVTELREAHAVLLRTNLDLEKLVEVRTAELVRSNAELEEFAYVASHDLREPLRMVSSYVQLLERRYKGRLDAEADKYIAFALEGAQRMQELIRDVLACGRVGSSPISVGTGTDGQIALDTALQNLKRTIEETGAIITCGSLPTLPVDPSQLTQLLQNLIGNALKFRRRDEPPCVHIVAARKKDMWEWSVGDNGIGIETAHIERIFGMFQRLHARGEYPGTGIGLAICKKIVERHGGRIGVESEHGRGAIFRFTLPAERTGDDYAGPAPLRLER